MNHWPFIIAAYVLTALLTFGLLWRSYVSMQRSESADHVRGDEG